VARIVRTTLAGWRRYRSHPNVRVRRRFAWESRDLATTYAAALGAMRGYYHRVPAMRAKISQLLRELCREFGWRARIAAACGGPYLVRKTRQEETRLRRGWSYEPPTFYTQNASAALQAPGNARGAEFCRYVTPPAASKKVSGLFFGSSRST
jgi:hypothetical protein